MQGKKPLAPIIFMILILIFAIIHLAVSISILVKVRNYGDVFGPERGLAGFNIVISIYAFIVGGFGLFAVLTDRGVLSIIVGLASVVLALFAFISLITALSINSLSINFVSNRFANHMKDYISNQDSRTIIDSLQTNYQCCGNNIWLDWASISLNATAPSTNATATTPLLTNTTIASNATTNVTTTIATNVTSTVSETNTTTTAGVVAGINATIASVATAIGISTTTSESTVQGKSSLQKSVRRKRQTQSSYGGIPGLPTSFGVTLPQSCCTSDTSATQSLSNLYCISNANTGSNAFDTDGCSKKLAKFSVGQSLGIAVINSFLVVLALAAIPILIKTSALEDPQQNDATNQPMSQYQQQYYYGQSYPPDQYTVNQYSNNYYPTNYNPGMSYNNNFNSVPTGYY